MKIALLGDIHGNHLALQAVLKSAHSLGAERYLVTGDMVGYYFQPDAVLASLADIGAVMVRGNHEDMLIRARHDPDYLATIDAKYGTGTRVALEALTDAQLDWLEALPHPLDLDIAGARVLLAHGTPWDLDQYLYPDSGPALLERCAEQHHDWILLGHTHHPMLRRVGASVIVNPGAVGQPRNRQPGAQWALLDLAAGACTFLNEPYDYAAVARQARERHPELPYLGDVLERTA